MEKPLKYSPEFQVGDVINTCFGYEQTILELVDVEKRKWCSGETRIYKICNSFSDVVYIHRYHSQTPHIIVGNIGEEAVKNILETWPFKDYDQKVKG